MHTKKKYHVFAKAVIILLVFKKVFWQLHTFKYSHANIYIHNYFGLCCS